MKKDDFQYEYLSSVNQREVEWLWYPYIPYGKITILQGDPGEGKSTFMLNIAALLTQGKAMPDGYPILKPQKVVYQTAEDNIADTVKPRLIAAGADCNKVSYIVDDNAPLTFEDPRLERIINETEARLLILDPLQAYLSQDSDILSAGRMRQQLRKVADIAEKTKCAVVIIGHMNKSRGNKNLYRGLGSIDITAIARSVLMITRDHVDIYRRYMFPVKTSLAPEGLPIAFQLKPEQGIEWLGTTEVNMNEQMNYSVDKNKLALAERILTETMEKQDVLSKDIMAKMKLMGVSERTVNKAKTTLGITSYRKNGVWYWHLEDESIGE